MKLIKLKKLTRLAMMAALCSATVHANTSEPDNIRHNIVNESNQWHDKAKKPVHFQSNTQYQAEVDGLEISLDTKGVVFGYELNNIAAIQPGGYLNMVSQSGTGAIALEVFADDDGKLGFDYRVNDLPVKHQGAAQQFLAEVLNKLLDKGVHGWRVNSLQHLVMPTKTSVADKHKITALTEDRLRLVANDTTGIFSSEDIRLANELLVSTLWQHGGQKIWSVVDNKASSPFNEMMITSRADFARLEGGGQLSIYHILGNGEHQTFGFDLNNDLLVGAFLNATGQRYQVGKTERELAEFLIRVHWQRTEGQLQWHQV